jgi:hypothetical protein
MDRLDSGIFSAVAALDDDEQVSFCGLGLMTLTDGLATELDATRGP